MSSCFEHSSLISRVASIPGGRDADGQPARAHVGQAHRPRAAPRTRPHHGRRLRARERRARRPQPRHHERARHKQSRLHDGPPRRRLQAQENGRVRQTQAERGHARARTHLGTHAPIHAVHAAHRVLLRRRRRRRPPSHDRGARRCGARRRVVGARDARGRARGGRDVRRQRCAPIRRVGIRRRRQRSVAGTIVIIIIIIAPTQNRSATVDSSGFAELPARFVDGACKKGFYSVDARGGLLAAGGDGGRCAVFGVSGALEPEEPFCGKEGHTRDGDGDGDGDGDEESAPRTDRATDHRGRSIRRQSPTLSWTAHRGWCSRVQFPTRPTRPLQMSRVRILPRPHRRTRRTCSPPAAWTARCARGTSP